MGYRQQSGFDYTDWETEYWIAYDKNDIDSLSRLVSSDRTCELSSPLTISHLSDSITLLDIRSCYTIPEFLSYERQCVEGGQSLRW